MRYQARLSGPFRSASLTSPKRAIKAVAMWIKRSTVVAIAIILVSVTTAPSNASSPSHIQIADNPSTDVDLTEQGAIEACHPKVPYAPPATLHRNDDESSGRIPIPLEMTPLNFLGRSVDALWVNNNGNITFDGTPPNVYALHFARNQSSHYRSPILPMSIQDQRTGVKSHTA